MSILNDSLETVENSYLGSGKANQVNNVTDDNFPDLINIDNVMKNMVREIFRECANINVRYSHELITYLVKLNALNPRFGIAEGKSLTREQVCDFIKNCVEQLTSENSPLVVALKMQLFYNKSFAQRSNLILLERAKYEQRLFDLEKEIITVTPMTLDEHEKCYRKIVFFVTLSSGMGNPTNAGVQREVYTALNSIFPIDELYNFIDDLKTDQKQKQLEELTYLVAGVRLYNRNINRGGEGIEDLPTVLQNSIEKYRNMFQEVLSSALEKIYFLTAAVENSYKVKEKEIFRPGAAPPILGQEDEIDLPENVDANYLIKIKLLLVVFRQYEIYIRKLIEELEVIESNAAKYRVQLANVITTLQSTVKNRQAIPTAVVFPIFTEIAEIWFKLQDEAIVLSNLQNINKELRDHLKMLSLNKKILAQMTKGADLVTDEQRAAVSQAFTIPIFHNKTRVLAFQNNSQLEFEFSGFCPWSLVTRNGALLPGNPQMGISRWKNKNYVFSSINAAKDFGQDPDLFVKGVLNLGRKHLCYIFLLQIYKDLIEVQDITELVVHIAPKIVTHNVKVQTSTHPIPEDSLSKYKWNIWDWKRNAIQLTNIVASQTHAPQTNKSHFHVGVPTQTYPAKDAESQTMSDNYTNVPTLQNFIYGLRGRKDDQQHVIELTRPVNE